MMKNYHKLRQCLLALMIILTISGCGSMAVERGPLEPFTIIALPDTQFYLESYPDIFLCQTKWINEQKEELNIVCAVHEGDITNNNIEKEWLAVDAAMSVLDGSVPYCMAPGNHDMGPGGVTSNRDTTWFNKFFGPQRFANQSWYGGHYADGNENAYYLFNAGSMKLLVLCLEFGPRDEVLAWAGKIIDNHNKYKVIVVTHLYMYFDDTRVGDGDMWNQHKYDRKANDGDGMWDKLVSKHENILMVLSGHILGDGQGRQISLGEKGNRVHEMLANYQMLEQGGNGWLRIMTFVPAERKIYCKSYSPWLKQYKTDQQNQFELDY